MSDSDDTRDTASRRRKPGQKPLAALAIAILALATGYWLYQRHTHVFSEDARIATRMIEVSTRTAGQVMDFPISQGDLLEPGTVIARIDDRSARLGLRELEAQRQSMQSSCERIEAQIDMVDRSSGGKLSAARSQLDAALASMASAQSDLQFKESEWERAQSLRERQIISQQQWENSRNARQQSLQLFQRAQAEAESARGNVVEAAAGQSQIQVLSSELQGMQHERERIDASIEKQKILIDDLRVESTASGSVDETFVHAGEYVVPGQRLLLMHNTADIWVDANIKETEIRRIQPGNPVAITVDAYPDLEFSGQVVRVGQSATSQFSLLPNTNPTGTFTKLTPRLPVAISLDQPGYLVRPARLVGSWMNRR